MTMSKLKHVKTGMTSLLVLSLIGAGCTRGSSGSENAQNTPAQAGAETTSETTSSPDVNVSQPMYKAMESELGKKILALDVFNKDESGMYTTSVAGQYLVQFLALGLGTTEEGITNLQASYEALLNQSLPGAQKDLAEIAEIRNAIEVSGIANENPEVRERMTAYAAALESKIAEIANETRNKELRSSLLVATGLGVVFFVVPTSKAVVVQEKAVAAVVQSQSAMARIGRRSVVGGEISVVSPTGKISSLMNRATGAYAEQAQAAVKAARIHEVSLNGLRRTIERAKGAATNAKHIESRNAIFRLLEVVGAKSTLLGHVDKVAVHGVRGLDVAFLGTGKGKAGSLVSRWRGDTRIIKPLDSSIKYQATAHPAIQAAVVKRGEDGGALILKITNNEGDEYIAFSTREVADQAENILKLGSVSREEAASNFRELTDSVINSGSTSMTAVVVDRVTGATAMVIAPVKRAVKQTPALIGQIKEELRAIGSSNIGVQTGSAAVSGGLRQKLVNAGAGFVFGFGMSEAYFATFGSTDIENISVEDIQAVFDDQDSFEAVEAVN